MSLEAARQAIVVDAAGAPLRGATLERWLTATNRPAGAAAAAVALSAWIDEALLATAIQQGAELDDSATVDEVILPDAVRGAIRGFWERRLNARAPATDAAVDSLSQLDRVRVYQQLFVAVPAGADSTRLKQVAARAAELIRRAPHSAAEFAALVREASDDSVGRRNNGFMPATTRAGMPSGLAATLWGLPAGGQSAALRSAAGYHLFRRATADESREGLRAWLRVEQARLADTRFTDSLLAAHQLKVAAEGLRAIRAIAREPVIAVDSAPVATWKGGQLLPSRVRLWVMMLQPEERAMLHDASDSATTFFLNEMAQREIVAFLAQPEPGISATAREVLAPQYRRALDSVKVDLGMTLAKSGSDPAAAAGMVLDSVVAGSRRFLPLPGALASVLRTRYPVKVDTLALDVLLRNSRRDWQRRSANDTTP